MILAEKSDKIIELRYIYGTVISKLYKPVQVGSFRISYRKSAFITLHHVPRNALIVGVICISKAQLAANGHWQ